MQQSAGRWRHPDSTGHSGQSRGNDCTGASMAVEGPKGQVQSYKQEIMPVLAAGQVDRCGDEDGLERDQSTGSSWKGRSGVRRGPWKELNP